MHKSIVFKGVEISFSSNLCFENFSSEVSFGSRIAVIGRNGGGKSSLLKMLYGKLDPTDGELIMPSGIRIGYVEQTINSDLDKSGGERLMKKLLEVMRELPDLLLLDEPTNHLDRENRAVVMRAIEKYQGTLFIVSHDKQLLKKQVDCFWLIDEKRIQTFSGTYDDFISSKLLKFEKIEKELKDLKHQKKENHQALMKEQKRASKSREKGKKSIEQKKWPTVVSHAKASRSEQTSGKKSREISLKKERIVDEFTSLRLPEVIIPKFSIEASDVRNGTVLSISDGEFGYKENMPILKCVNLSLYGNDHIAIRGKNAAGKSSLLKAIISQGDIWRKGEWKRPKRALIGYLDQHYSNLQSEDSILEHLHRIRPDWTAQEHRRHLNDFLFKKNEEVEKLVKNLSGGEKA